MCMGRGRCSDNLFDCVMRFGSLTHSSREKEMGRSVQGLNLVGLVVYITSMIWMHREQSEQVIQLRSEVRALSAAMDAQTAVASEARPSVNTETNRQTSPSELHKPAGPMPRSILVQSNLETGQLGPGVDVTSDIKRRKVDPCVVPCRRLSVCALDRNLCPLMDTRNQDRVIDLCIARCREDKATRAQIVSSTQCTDAVELAHGRLNGFTQLCVK